MALALALALVVLVVWARLGSRTKVAYGACIYMYVDIHICGGFQKMGVLGWGSYNKDYVVFLDTVGPRKLPCRSVGADRTLKGL